MTSGILTVLTIANKYITNGSKNNTYWYPTRFGAYFSNIELYAYMKYESTHSI